MGETRLLLKKAKTGKEMAEIMLKHFRSQPYYKSSSVKKVGDFSMFDGLTLDDVSVQA